jgi:5'-deoxynucleotidase YfbR-like HD superfamily hydrolase
MIKDIFKLLRSGRVRRWHTNPDMPTTERNDEHQWMVTVIALYLDPSLADSGAALAYALTHDAGEMETCDVPSRLKRSNSSLVNLLGGMEQRARHALIETPLISNEHRHTIHVADRLAGHLVFMRENPRQYVRDHMWGSDGVTLTVEKRHGVAAKVLLDEWYAHHVA